MKVLALDTTTRAGSAAIVVDDRVVEERRGDDARSHAERLPRELIALAEAHALGLADFDVFAVASGPGSFTGLRIGIATMQGLALVARRRMVGVSALEALAHAASESAAALDLVASWMDAYRREVFAGLYRVSGEAAPVDAARLIEVDGARVGDPAAVLESWRPLIRDRRVTFVGDGAQLYGDVVRRDVPGARILPAPLLAGVIGRLATARTRCGESVDPGGIQPLYVRRPDAELARENAPQR
jgi:tRNA threonylcarbamoyladenosine biosynthesis protein TsaB